MKSCSAVPMSASSGCLPPNSRPKSQETLWFSAAHTSFPSGGWGAKAEHLRTGVFIEHPGRSSFTGAGARRGGGALLPSAGDGGHWCSACEAVLKPVCSSRLHIGGQLLSNLSYADDIAAVSKSQIDLQNFLNSLARHATEVGLSINVSKTECMTTDKSNQPLHLSIYDKPIKQVTEFVYLGHKLSATNDGSTAVKHRIALGWAAFSRNKQLLTSRRVPMHVKARIYNTYILPVVTYGLECVNWTTKLCSKIETFQNHIMRCMTNHHLTDHIEIKELRRITSLKPIMAIIRSRTLKLYGHIKRSQSGLSKLCLEGLVEGKRSRGRQPKRWRDNIYEWSGLTLPTLNRTVLNRNLWRRMTHVGAHSAICGDSEI